MRQSKGSAARQRAKASSSFYGRFPDSEDLKTAWKRYGRKENANRTVHFSLSAETLKRKLGEPVLAFLSQHPEDIYAALLLVHCPD